MDEVLLKSSHFAKETHFLGVRYLHVWVHVSSCAIQDDELTWVSRVEKSVFKMSEVKMAMCSFFKIIVDGFRVCLDFVSKFVESF